MRAIFLPSTKRGEDDDEYEEGEEDEEEEEDEDEEEEQDEDDEDEDRARIIALLTRTNETFRVLSAFSFPSCTFKLGSKNYPPILSKIKPAMSATAQCVP